MLSSLEITGWKKRSSSILLSVLVLLLINCSFFVTSITTQQFNNHTSSLAGPTCLSQLTPVNPADLSACHRNNITHLLTHVCWNICTLQDLILVLVQVLIFNTLSFVGKYNSEKIASIDSVLQVKTAIPITRKTK